MAASGSRRLALPLRVNARADLRPGLGRILEGAKLASQPVRVSFRFLAPLRHHEAFRSGCWWQSFDKASAAGEVGTSVTEGEQRQVGLAADEGCGSRIVEQVDGKAPEE